MISSCFGSLGCHPPPNGVVWGKEHGLTHSLKSSLCNMMHCLKSMNQVPVLERVDAAIHCKIQVIGLPVYRPVSMHKQN